MLLRLNRYMAAIARRIEGASRVTGVLASLTIMIMMLSTALDVAGRYLFNRPVPGVIELNQLLMALIVFMGLAYTQLSKGHIQVDAAIRWLPARWRFLTDALGYLVGLGLFGVISVKGAQTAWLSWQAKDYVWGVIQFPLWPSKMFVPLGSALLCALLVVDFLRNVKQAIRPNK